MCDGSAMHRGTFSKKKKEKKNHVSSIIINPWGVTVLDTIGVYCELLGLFWMRGRGARGKEPGCSFRRILTVSGSALQRFQVGWNSSRIYGMPSKAIVCMFSMFSLSVFVRS